MITLIRHPAAHYTGHYEVLLDVVIQDLKEPTDETRALITEACAASRKVGCILRQFGGNTYFSYDPVNQAQLEVSLLAALAVPKTDVHVEQSSGGRGKW